MKKLFVMAAMVLSSVGAFAQQAAGTTTIQPKVGLNVSTIGDNEWKAPTEDSTIAAITNNFFIISNILN